MTPRELADKAINYAGSSAVGDAYRALGWTLREHLDFCESKPRNVKKKKPPKRGRDSNPSQRGIAGK